MIISHKYKFILLRPRKVASTSIEMALAEECDMNDIVTPDLEYNPKRDIGKYKHSPRNYKGFYNHMPAKEVLAKVGKEIWNNYTKITAVRNPWDLIVSNYWWEAQGNILFSKFVKEQYLDNDQFYFDAWGKPIADFYIRVENIEEDYKKVCEFLNIKYKPLKRLKAKVRGNNAHYSTYYTTYTRDLVAKRYHRDIEFFKYSFEQVADLPVEKVSFKERFSTDILDLFRETRRRLTKRIISI